MDRDVIINNGHFAFKAAFDEHEVVMRGIENVEIKNGIVYVEYPDGTVKAIGALYCTVYCTTPAANEIKEVTLQSEEGAISIEEIVLQEGNLILVSFKYTNTHGSPKLKFNNMAALPIKQDGRYLSYGDLFVNRLYALCYKTDHYDTVGFIELGRKPDSSIGAKSFAFGSNVTASGDYSHSEGYNSSATGFAAHAEGTSVFINSVQTGTSAAAMGSHAEGGATSVGAGANYGHAEGYHTVVSAAEAGHAEGYQTKAQGLGAHAEGSSYTENNETVLTVASGAASHAEGFATSASREASHAEGKKTSAGGNFSHAEGLLTKTGDANDVTKGVAAHAEGDNTTASGNASHAEGSGTTASGVNSHAEGSGTTASENFSHAEGSGTTASAWGAHAEGTGTTANANFAHAEGNASIASGLNSHAEGNSSEAQKANAHAEGNSTIASGTAAHAEGGLYNNKKTTASGVSSHAEGQGTVAFGDGSHSEGQMTTAQGPQSHAEGISTLAGILTNATKGIAAHAEGYATLASGNYAHAEGGFYNNNKTTASGVSSHAEGEGSKAVGEASHAEGRLTTAGDPIDATNGIAAHAEGIGTFATGKGSHAEGNGGQAEGNFSHAEGSNYSITVGGETEEFILSASGTASHAEGQATAATNEAAHAEGRQTTASGEASHAEGVSVQAKATGSHAEGVGTKANAQGQHVEGKYNVESNTYLHVIGNGTADNARSNAHILTNTGEAHFKGNVFVQASAADASDGLQLATLLSPALTGTPTAPTAAFGTNTTQIATTAFVQTAFKNLDAMLFKGIVNSNSDLPASHEAGWTYKVGTAGTYAGKVCEVGDMIICLKDRTTANNDDWGVIQNNIDRAVTSPNTSTTDNIVTYSNNSGLIVKDSGKKFVNSIPVHSQVVNTDVPTNTAVESYVLAWMDYKQIAVNSLSVNPALAEKGSTVSSATLTYGLNKDATAMELDSSTTTNDAGTMSASGTITKSVSLTANKTWTLWVQDTRPDGSHKEAFKTCTTKFVNRVFYGPAEDPREAVNPGTINSAFVRGLAYNQLDEDGVVSGVSITTTTKQYMWYASTVNNLKFNVGGFDGGFETPIGPVKVKDASNNNEDNYYVYRSTYSNLGNKVVTVKK